MVNLDICLRIEYVEDQARWQMGMRGVAEMAVEQKIKNMVEGERDSTGTPDVDLPLVSDTVSSPPDNIKVLEV